ncbi:MULTISPECIES: hypothetical protein [Pseudoalteromonas]|uniref:AbiU2 domain-containing protein n=1 Tax=Pseudoalteromonas TaxID=53246 RepID=UPI0004286CD5|nr:MULTISPECIES: hypothetical protein [Pseudoalteromonas]PKG62641.1 hypothetical protein CXF75_17465 [Pseudoalteromonas arctica]PKG70374.1 hypothetical protein CXF64_10305 [Pseudoalteromonas sp. GutCa3]
MSIDKPETRIYASYDEFCKERGLPLPHRVEFDRTKVNQDELKVIKEYFTNLCLDLTIYSDLFTEQQSIDAMNEFNSLVFSRIQKAYIEKLCLSLACLLDPAQTGKNKNLSLARVITQCECPELDGKYSELLKLYEFTGIKSWRSKLLAHNDLNTLMGKKKLDLKFEHDDIESIIELIQEIFDDISDPTVHTDIRIILPFEQDVNQFVSKLKLASNKNA